MIGAHLVGVCAKTKNYSLGTVQRPTVVIQLIAMIAISPSIFGASHSTPGPLFSYTSIKTATSTLRVGRSLERDC
jgi:hypothetical protein